MTDESLFSRLRIQRKRLGLTQREAAERVGVTRETWSRYEKGLMSPGAETLEAIAAAGADVQYILTGVHGVPAMSAEEERAGYVVEVLSPAEAAALEALRGSGALQQDQSAVVEQTGNGNVFQQSQGGANHAKGRTTPKRQR